LREIPGWEDLPEEPTVAVNREYSRPDRELHAGDELALIPPVAGG
jgi:molybdopterin converting factor small subunit